MQDIDGDLDRVYAEILAEMSWRFVLTVSLIVFLVLLVAGLIIL